MTQKIRRKISQKYFEKNGGIYEVFNNLDKKRKYEKFLTKLDKEIKLNWTQKRNKTETSKKTIKWKK